MKTTYVSLLSVAVIFCLVSCNTQPEAVQQAEDTNEERFEDDMEDAAETLAEAYTLNNKIMTVSQLAANHTAIGEELKDLAQQLQTDHQQVEQQMSDLASTYNIALPQNITYDNQSDVEKLRNAEPEEFAEDFQEIVDNANEELLNTIRELEDEADDVNTDIANFAQQLIPTLEAHEDRLDQLEDAM